MELNDFILKFLEHLKTTLTNTVSDLTPAELKWQAGPEANPMGFILWHLIRAEDRFVNTTFQGKPQVWEQGEWHQKMNLPGDSNNTGGGYTAEQVASFAVPKLEVLLQYSDAVRKQTVEYIKNMKPEGFDRIINHPRMGQVTVAQIIVYMIGEIYQHIGHVAYLRGLARSFKQEKTTAGEMGDN